MKKKNLIISILLIFCVFGVIFLMINFSKNMTKNPLVTNFEECKNAGYPTMESYPAQCRDVSGRLFIEIINTEFSKPVTLRVNNMITFPDGLSIYLKEINDSRCKPDVQCIWAGELSALFSLSIGIATPNEEVHLGTVNNKSITIKGYTITLQNATETTATINVSYKAPVSGQTCYVGGCSSQICSSEKGLASTCEYKEEYACYKNATCEVQQNGQCGWTETPALLSCVGEANIATGYVAGKVTIGPFCPVEKEGEPCAVPPEAYSSREIIIYASDKTTIKKKLKLNNEGRFYAAIAPGSYYLQVSPAGIGPGEKKFAVVKDFETTTLNFDIDTGIR